MKFQHLILNSLPKQVWLTNVFDLKEVPWFLPPLLQLEVNAKHLNGNHSRRVFTLFKIHLLCFIEHTQWNCGWILTKVYRPGQPNCEIAMWIFPDFFCHSDFTWNQFQSFLKPKNCFSDHMSRSGIWIFEQFIHFKMWNFS